MRRRIAFVLISIAVVLVFASTWWTHVAAVACAVFALLFFEGRESLRSVHPAAALGLALVLSGFLGMLIWAVGWERGSAAGGILASRLLVLASCAHLIARSVDAERILVWMKEHGFERFGLALSLSLNALPSLSSVVQEVWIGHRNRFSSRRSAVIRAPELLELVLAHTARIASDAAAAAALRGHSSVVESSTLSVPTGIPILVLTGPASAGKTPALEEVCTRLQAQGISVSGFLQLKFRDENGRQAFRIRDLSNNREVVLARETLQAEGSFGTRFDFETEGLQLGAEALSSAQNGDLLVVDELGPVELRGGGHFPALQARLRRIRPTAMVLVLRRHLVPAFIARLDAVDVRLIDLSQGYQAAIANLLTQIDEIRGLSEDG